MTTLQGVRLLLLIFALAAFAGAGATLAMARHRVLVEGERDVGLGGIAVMFIAFGALCTYAASGFLGVVGFGAIVTWASYLLVAQRVGLFTIEAHFESPSEYEAPEHRTTNN